VGSLKAHGDIKTPHGLVGGWSPVPVLPLATGPRHIPTPPGNLGPFVVSVAGHVSGPGLELS